jgi:integrase/recombinase XerD
VVKQGRFSPAVGSKRTKSLVTARRWCHDRSPSRNQLFIFTDWVRHLETNRSWKPEDSLFPSTALAWDENQRFAAAGLSRKYWKTAAPIRKIFRSAFALAGLPYYNPHSFRSTLARLGEKLSRNGEDMTSWSLNLGHERVQTTLTSYGKVPEHRQFEVIAELGAERPEAEIKREQIRRFVSA